MQFISDEQRKAMFARLHGGGGGVTWVFKTPGASGQYAQNTNHKNPQYPGHRYIPGVAIGMGTTSGGLKPPPIYSHTFTFDTNMTVAEQNESLGIANYEDWQQALGNNAHMPQFNILKPLVGWDPVSWTDFFFTGTVFEKKKKNNKTVRVVDYEETSVVDFMGTLGERLNIGAKFSYQGKNSYGAILKKNTKAGTSYAQRNEKKPKK